MSDLVTMLDTTWTWISGTLLFLLSMGLALHALMNRKESTLTLSWIALVLFSPIIGALLYLMFGINRVQRRASALRGKYRLAPPSNQICELDHPESCLAALKDGNEHLIDLARLVGRIMDKPLTNGNQFQCLRNGDMAYPEMLAAIEAATTSISLSSYIFNPDSLGNHFIDALAKAVARGVEVRVLIDDVGSRYSHPRAFPNLMRKKIPYAAFLPSLLPWELKYVNLRNHRKILVIDGRIGFIGGLNIQASHLLSTPSSFPVRDLHFRVQGPVVQQIQQGFVEDWLFATREVLKGPAWFPPLEAKGTAVARALCDGPDDDFDQLRHILFAAFSGSKRSIAIVTPYFVPDQLLLTALSIAAIRGVQVDILMPAKNNLALVRWASTALWPNLIRSGARIWLEPGYFDHAKLIVIDQQWCLFGSGNMDNRSLKLNFEINVESYDAQLCAELTHFIQEKRAASHQVTQEELQRQSKLHKLRQQLASLLGPLL